MDLTRFLPNMIRPAPNYGRESWEPPNMTSAPAWTFKESALSLHRFLKVADKEELVVDLVVADADHIEIIDRALPAESHAGPVPVARKEDVIRMKRARNSKQDQADIEALQNDKD